MDVVELVGSRAGVYAEPTFDLKARLGCQVLRGLVPGVSASLISIATTWGGLADWRLRVSMMKSISTPADVR